MSDATEPTPATEPPAPPRGCRVTLVEVIVVIAILASLVGLGLPAVFLIEVPITLAFGWVQYLWRVVPNASPDPWVIGTALACLIGVIVGAHFFLRWISGAGSEWPMKRTLQLVGLVVLLFVAGIAMVGMT